VLAYVFWHWPAPSVDTAGYERAHLAFQDALAHAHLPGFQASVACRVEGAEWLPGLATAYEDWYLVHDFTALGLLNEGAVAGACRVPHDDVARVAAGGTAGLYRLVDGGAEAPVQPFAVWFPKPAGMSYAAFSGVMATWTDRAGVSLWQRQMTLGPTPEFCLLSPEAPALALPGLAESIAVRRRVIWPSGARA
jgi:hypothetical protein